MKHSLMALLAAMLASAPAYAQETSGPMPETVVKFATPLMPEQADNRGTWSLTYENDVFVGSDRDYTNGVRLSYTTPTDNVSFLLQPLAYLIPTFPEEGRKRVSYAFGQSMFTPSDIARYDLMVNDRPYAGWLYGSVGLISDTGNQLDTLELTLGIVGPYSLARPTQRFVHEYITDSTIPRGWSHQLDNEPGIIASYERKWRSYLQFTALGHGVDFTPHLGASLGNVMTDARTGVTLRLGKHLPADYGPPRVRPSLSGSDFFLSTNRFGWYLFAGVEGRYVARNIFLDGNTFGSSHSVDKKNWVGDIQAGIALTYRDVRIAFTHVERSREYETQDQADRFGAITISTKF